MKYHKYIPALTVAGVLASVSVSFAATQEEVLKSISSSVDQPPVDGTQLMAAGIAAGALLLVLVLYNFRRKREDRPKTVNHYGKMMKELGKSGAVRNADLKKAKAIAATKNLESPLVALLCPSLASERRN